jgi:hypothetical protein
VKYLISWSFTRIALVAHGGQTQKSRELNLVFQDTTNYVNWNNRLCYCRWCLYVNWKLQKLWYDTYTFLYHHVLHIKDEIHYSIKLHQGSSRGSWWPKATNSSTLSPCISPQRYEMLSFWKHLGLMVIQLSFCTNTRMYVVVNWQEIMLRTDSANDTILVVIPNVKNISLPSQFWPIWFMQYLVDKTTYKFLANHLNKFNDQSLYLREIKVDPSPPSVNHLLFAVDNLLFSR